MNSSDELLEQFLAWAHSEPSIVVVILFGSRARPIKTAGSSDDWSDVDLHVVTTRPRSFLDKQWTKIFSEKTLRGFTARAASGGVIKVTAIFRSGGELDVVVVPAAKLRLARVAVGLGLHRSFYIRNTGLNELATVLRGGHQILKGGLAWQKFYQRVISEMPGSRLDDIQAKALADEFVCDFLWILKKLERGELIASQRMLHRSLVEINFRLLHELRLRRGEHSYREARRLEQILSPTELGTVAIEADLSYDSLLSAAKKNAATCRDLVFALLGKADNWPI